jgi:hypothetical protein
MALVENRLEPHRHLTIKRDPGRLTVTVTADGFDVMILDDGGEATVGMGGWHGHYSDPGEAADIFVKLLTQEARVRLTIRGGRCTSGVLELAQGDEWAPLERCTLVFGWLRLGRKRVEVVQNHLI